MWLDLIMVDNTIAIKIQGQGQDRGLLGVLLDDSLLQDINTSPLEDITIITDKITSTGITNTGITNIVLPIGTKGSSSKVTIEAGSTT